jgi:hypothetical protein
MASIYRAPNARSKTSYIATMAYPTNIFQYTQVVDANLDTQGYLSSLQSLTTGNVRTCSKGRVLVETGERLFPGQPGISTFMVKVVDINSKLSGYIDPNCMAFAQYNDNRPVELDDGVDTSGNVLHRGQAVYTLGNATVRGTLGVSGEIVSAGQVRSSNLTTLAAQVYSTGTATIAINIDGTLGQVFSQLFTLTGGTNAFTITSTTVPPVGSVVYLILRTSGTHTTAGTVSAGTNVKMVQVALGTAASRWFGLTFVSDGTNLIQVGGDTAATAMA